MIVEQEDTEIIKIIDEDVLETIGIITKEDVISAKYVKNEYEDSIYITHKDESTSSKKYGYRESVNDFAAICKIWARSQGYYIQSYIRLNAKMSGLCMVNKYGWSSNMELIEDYSEPKSIIKSCVWIKNKEINKRK